MASRKDVAEMAGVSPAVVSYVLNNSNYVSREKRKAVLEAVEKLGYQPDYAAKSLKEKKTYNLGLICDDIRNELFSEIAFYSEKYANENGYKLFLCASHQEDSFLKSIVNGRLDGIFLGTSIYKAEQINWIVRNDIPVVLYKTRKYENLDARVKCLEIDYYRATYEITVRLIKRGFCKIGFFPPYLSKNRLTGNGDYRFKGYTDALKKYGIAYDPKLVCFDNSSYEIILKNAEQMCRNFRDDSGKFAYVIGNDFNAVQIMGYLKKTGLYSQEKIAIIGMDNTACSQIVSPALTTIGFSKEDVAREAIEFLVKGKEIASPQPTRIPMFLVEGESG